MFPFHSKHDLRDRKHDLRDRKHDLRDRKHDLRDRKHDLRTSANISPSWRSTVTAISDQPLERKQLASEKLYTVQHDFAIILAGFMDPDSALIVATYLLYVKLSIPNQSTLSKPIGLWTMTDYRSDSETVAFIVATTDGIHTVDLSLLVTERYCAIDQPILFAKRSLTSGYMCVGTKEVAYIFNSEGVQIAAIENHWIPIKVGSTAKVKDGELVTTTFQLYSRNRTHLVHTIIIKHNMNDTVSDMFNNNHPVLMEDDDAKFSIDTVNGADSSFLIDNGRVPRQNYRLNRSLNPTMYKLRTPQPPAVYKDETLYLVDPVGDIVRIELEEKCPEGHTRSVGPSTTLPVIPTQSTEYPVAAFDVDPRLNVIAMVSPLGVVQVNNLQTRDTLHVKPLGAKFIKFHNGHLFALCQSENGNIYVTVCPVPQIVD